MLLIDKRRHVRSLMPHRVPEPFVREWFRHDRAAVHAFFQWCETDPGFLQALGEELQRCLSWFPTALPYPDALVDAGERAIADGLIGVGSMLPDDVTVGFDDDRPTAWAEVTTVEFADPAITERFVSAMLTAPGNSAAFEAALAHPAGRRYFAAAPTQGAAGSGSPAPGDEASLAARASTLLVTRHLGLVPRDLSRRVLWLVWMEIEATLAVAASAPPPASPSAPAPPPGPPPDAPASTLADAPDDVSPQAQTLIDAAQDGTPFCEECARRAAELANA